MPKLDPKTVQKEIEGGQFWPVYWIHGTETLKIQELLKRLKKSILGDQANVFNEMKLEGGEITPRQILEEAQTLSFGGGVRWVLIRDAHLVKDLDQCASLLGPKRKLDQLESVVVFVAKDLDGRKKFSKLLTEQAAVVACEAVEDADKEAWIKYLADRAGVPLSDTERLALRSIDPWTLEIIERELEKLSIARSGSDTTGASGDVLLSHAPQVLAEQFIDAFFTRNKAQALLGVKLFAENPDESFPLLGLLGWHVRQLAQFAGGSRAGVPSFIAQKLDRYSKNWSTSELEKLAAQISEMDFLLKQTPRLPLSVWGELVAGL